MLDRILLTVHVIAGFSALALFFVPAIARKGGKAHNRFGRWYVRAMWAVTISAAVLSAINYYEGQRIGPLFLGFLDLLTARPLYFGIAVLRNKRGPSPGMRRIDTALRGGLFLASPYLIGTGFGWWGPGANTLLIIFGGLGLAASARETIAQLRGRPAKYNWLQEHIGQMVVTAIAAFTAFFAFGGVRLFGDFFTGNLMIVVWSAPTALGLIFSAWYQRRLKAGKVMIEVRSGVESYDQSATTPDAGPNRQVPGSVA